MHSKLYHWLKKEPFMEKRYKTIINIYYIHIITKCNINCLQQVFYDTYIGQLYFSYLYIHNKWFNNFIYVLKNNNIYCLINLTLKTSYTFIPLHILHMVNLYLWRNNNNIKTEKVDQTKLYNLNIWVL